MCGTGKSVFLLPMCRQGKCTGISCMVWFGCPGGVKRKSDADGQWLEIYELANPRLMALRSPCLLCQELPTCFEDTTLLQSVWKISCVRGIQSHSSERASMPMPVAYVLYEANFFILVWCRHYHSETWC
ncbi:unnamed protein product [Hapterophycus canaliculatus]